MDNEPPRDSIPIVPIPEVSGTQPRMGETLLVYASDGYQLLHDQGIDHGPRVGIVVGLHGDMPVANMTLLMDNSRTFGDPVGTVPACPVYDELSEPQREYLRKQPQVYYWAERPKAR